MQDNLSTPSIPWWKALAYALGFLVFYLIIAGLTQLLAVFIIAQIQGVPPKTVQIHPSTLQEFWIRLISILADMLAFWLFWTKILSKPFASLGLVWKGFQGDFWKGCLFGILLITIGTFALAIGGFLRVDAYQFNIESFLLWFLIFVMVAISEEMLCRGVLYNTLHLGMPPLVALGVSALIFGALHLLNDGVTFFSFLNVSLAGLLLGISNVYRQNLMFPIGLHFTWNFFQGPVFGFEVSGNNCDGIIRQNLQGDALFTGGAFGFEGSIFCSIIVIIGVFVIKYYFLNQQSKHQL